MSKEQEEYDHYATCTPADDTSTGPPKELPPTKGLKNLWKKYNAKSIDGLPALEFAPESGRPLENWREKVKYEPDDESVASKESGKGKGGGGMADGYVGDVGKLLVGFAAGAVTSALVGRLYSDVVAHALVQKLVMW